MTGVRGQVNESHSTTDILNMQILINQGKELLSRVILGTCPVLLFSHERIPQAPVFEHVDFMVVLFGKAVKPQEVEPHKRI